MLNIFKCENCNTTENKYTKKLCKKCYNKIYSKKYYKENKQKFLDAANKRYNENKEECLKGMKEYAKNNKEKLKIYQAEYYRKNYNKLREGQDKYYNEVRKLKNKEDYQIRKERINNNPERKFIENLRTRQNSAIKNHKGTKFTPSLDLLGADIKTVRKHIEKQFQNGMSWENHGLYGWHIDHIKPCCQFDLSKEEDQRKCFHYTNLQPLWAKDNLSKGGNI